MLIDGMAEASEHHPKRRTMECAALASSSSFEIPKSACQVLEKDDNLNNL